MHKVTDVQHYTKKGTYVLILSVNELSSVRVGQLGELQLHPGIYLYVGSAMGSGSTSLPHRLARHLRRTKTMKWHIDFITTLPQTKIHYIVLVETSRQLECLLSRHIAILDITEYPMKGFGSSDCSQCETHFYSYTKNAKKAVKACEKIIRKLGFLPMIISMKA